MATNNEQLIPVSEVLDRLGTHLSAVEHHLGAKALAVWFDGTPALRISDARRFYEILEAERAEAARQQADYDRKLEEQQRDEVAKARARAEKERADRRRLIPGGVA